ncbi:3-keto-5-aminohexanoate cleavage protein [Hoeflea sp. CAU 1731]
MLQACLNGGWKKDHHIAVPLTITELVRDASSVRAAGADELHIHVRASDGAETLEPDAVRQTLEAVRAIVPDMPIGVGTGAWIAPGGRARHDDMQNWTVKPNYASVNLNEEDAPDVIALLTGMGVGIEAGLWSTQDARRFVDEIDFDTCLRVLVEMPDVEGVEAKTEAAAVISMLEKAGCNLPVLLPGQGQSVWPCVDMAWERGLSTRIGFEDTFLLSDGSLAPDNAALVEAAKALNFV